MNKKRKRTAASRWKRARKRKTARRQRTAKAKPHPGDKLAAAHPKTHQEPTAADHKSFVKANHDNDQSRILRERNAKASERREKIRKVRKRAATAKRKTKRVSARRK